jgi:hypothetical protein
LATKFVLNEVLQNQSIPRHGEQILQFSPFSVLEKKRGSHLFREYFIFKTTLFISSKHHKVFNTSVYSETKVFYEYFKNTLMPNGA